MSLRLRLCHLYPDLLNIYGDRGNVLALARRAAWRGIELEVATLTVGDELDPGGCDLVFMGGGQDQEQALVAADLARRKGPVLRDAVEEGLPLLAVCGSYQLLGRFYRPAGGAELPGVGVFDAWTVAGEGRLIGNVLAVTDLTGAEETVVGFENHSGRTHLGEGARPLARVLVGGGNNGEDGTEGAVHRHAVGTYLHGSLLPKNPFLADWLLARALERRYGAGAAAALTPLADGLERRAHAAAARRARETRGRAGRR